MEHLDVVKRLDRAFRIGILGISDLLTKKDRSRHRHKTVDAPLRRDEIVQTIVYAQAIDPKRKLESIVVAVAKYYGVSRSYVFRILKEVDPERLANMKAFAAVFAEPQGKPLMTLRVVVRLVK